MDEGFNIGRKADEGNEYPVSGQSQKDGDLLYRSREGKGVIMSKYWRVG